MTFKDNSDISLESNLSTDKIPEIVSTNNPSS